MSDERSGIDMLMEILDKLNTLEKRMNVLDLNVKTIANGSNLAGLITKAIDTPYKEYVKAMKPKITAVETPDTNGFKNFKFHAVDTQDKISKQSGDNKIRVTGKIKINSGKKIVPLPGVTVKVYDTQDKLVKNTKTNKAGHWMGQLLPGKYVVSFDGEFKGQKLQQQNINFEVPSTLPEGVSEFEVI